MTRHTLQDVARRAGVSKATASRVLNRSVQVDPDTRQRVLDAMEDLEFTPSPAARRLSLGRTLTIGVVTSFLTRPQAAERLRGVDAVLDRQRVRPRHLQRRVRREARPVSAGRSPSRSGPTACSSCRSRRAVRTLPRLVAAAMPVVVIDVHSAGVEGLPHVVGDDIAGGAARHASHLLELGHREIAFIGDEFDDPFGFTSSRDRYRRLSSGRTQRPASRPRPESSALGAHGRYEARELARRTADRRTHRPTAIFAASDTQALGVIAAAREAGLHVPDDLSVVGYDDIEVADYVGLTTVRQQLFESGRLGAEILLAEIGQRSASRPSIVLRPRGRGPCHHGATEGGPCMRTRTALTQASGATDEELMEEIARSIVPDVTRGRTTRVVVGAHPARRHRARPTRRRGDRRAPSVAAAAPTPRARAAGPIPSSSLRLLRNGVSDVPQRSPTSSTKQFPNVTWKISEDQFANLMTATPRLLSSDNPPDLIRLPTMVVARQGRPAQEPRRVRDRVRLGQVARRPARARIGSHETAPAVRGRSTRWASTTA